MSLGTVDLDAVRQAGQLISVADAMAVLETTEPMQEKEFDLNGADKVSFGLPDGWNENFADIEPTDVTDATIRLHGEEHRLTKEALLTMTSSVGLQKTFVGKTPGPLVKPSLDYWVNNNGVAQAECMRLLIKDDVGVAFIKSSLSTFQNIPVFNTILDAAETHFGTDRDSFLVDVGTTGFLVDVGIQFCSLSILP